MASCWFLGTGAASPRAEGPRRALSGARSDQPSHTLPPAQRSPCHGRVARADVSTSGAQDRLLSSVSPTFTDSLLTMRLPLHVLVLEEPRHRLPAQLRHEDAAGKPQSGG